MMQKKANNNLLRVKTLINQKKRCFLLIIQLFVCFFLLIYFKCNL